jgi:hypothetical protein
MVDRKPLASPAQQGFIVRDTLGEEQPLNSVDMLHTLCREYLALAADSAAILFLRGRA